MDWKLRTKYFVFLTAGVFAVLWIAYDVIAIRNAGIDASISFIIYELSREFPIYNTLASMVLGILIGHFVWPIKPIKRG